MTFCLGMKVKDGLIGIADTRITSGTERVTAKKVTVHQHGKHSIFVMTSGLRSARDKALTYFREVLEETEAFTHLYKAVNSFAAQIRKVSDEDRPALERSGLSFNLHALVGGQLEGDTEHRLYMIYPEGNWVEVGDSTPFYIIGESGYGKPILERSLQYGSDLSEALKIGFLAFNATITCAVDVDYPIDVVAYRKNTYQIIEERYTKEEISDLSVQWQKLIREAVPKLPGEWTRKVIDKLPPTNGDKKAN
ncbi:MAG: peptidase [Candidatus Omnitrophica bacterium]|jgi:putative proteasome-type protease|nr:peptidase [Candidatus Omnitrophota bacterium]